VSIQLPKAVFFDMDNTILAYDSKSPQSWERAFARFAPQLKGVDVQQFGDAMNEIRPWFWGDPARDQRARLDLTTARREMVALAFSRLGVDAGEAGSEMADAYGDIQEESIEAYPGAIDTLRRLREMGKGMALITNGVSRLQRAKIDRFGLEPFFDCIIIEGEFGAGKPDPRVYQHALERLAVQPSEAMMVGDNLQADIAGAQALGIYTVWVDWKGVGLPEGSPVTPDSTVRAISELLP
jgi:putative hydrolase of the HAD superfamily